MRLRARAATPVNPSYPHQADSSINKTLQATPLLLGSCRLPTGIVLLKDTTWTSRQHHNPACPQAAVTHAADMLSTLHDSRSRQTGKFLQYAGLLPLSPLPYHCLS
jgi:hypothetical protein